MTGVQTCALPILANFWNELTRVKKLADPSPVMVVLFHNFDFREEKRGIGSLSLEYLEDILRWARSQPNVRITTFGQLAREREGFNHARLQEMQSLMREGESKLLPSHIAVGYSIPAFPGYSADMLAMRFRRRVTFAMFWAAIVLVTLGVAWAATIASARLMRAPYWLVPGLLWIGACLSCRLLVPSPREFKIACCLIEALLLAIVAWVVRRRERRGPSSSAPGSA